MTIAQDNTLFATITETTDTNFDPNNPSLNDRYTLNPGDTFIGNLTQSTTNWDLDIVAISVTAGNQYTIDVAGYGSSPISDTYMYVLNDQGALVGQDDDGGPGVNSQYTYSASYTGLIYIVIDSYSGTETGGYSVNVSYGSPVTPPPAGTYDDMAYYLTDGFWYDAGTVPGQFSTTSGNQITVNITGLTAAEQQLARWAFEAWEMVADLEFVEVGGSAALTFGNTDTYYGETFSAYTTQPGDGAEIIITSAWTNYYGTAIDSYSFSTYVHELGHALGLGHMGNYNGTGDYYTEAVWLDDSWQLSIMSYFDQTQNPYVEADYAALTTAMLVDIIAIQDLYGAASGGVTAGATTWGFNSNIDNYLSDLFDAMAAGGNALYSGGPIALTIFDEGGIDTIDLSLITGNSTINMLSEGISDVDGVAGNLLIARGTVIENLILGSGNDSVIGNNASNNIIAGNGHDTIEAANGADTIDAGVGNDSVSGGGWSDLILGGLGNDTIDGGAGNDTMNGGGNDDVILGLLGHDSIIGEGGNDDLRGHDGRDTINGGLGDDTILGGVSNDVLLGSGGNDSIVGWTGNDSMDGGAGNDRMIGSIGLDTMIGGDGNDYINGGLYADEIHGDAGLDTIIGDDGNDWIDGGADNDSITGNGGADTIYGGLGDDSINGGNFDDLLLGEGGNDDIYGGNGLDTIRGGAGADYIEGNGGEDYLAGQDGNDTMFGGMLGDTFRFNLGDDADVIGDFQNDLDTIWIDADLMGTMAIEDLGGIATVVGGNLVLDFGGGDTLTLNGVTNVNILFDDIVLV